MPKIVFLDLKTLGSDISFDKFDSLGEIEFYNETSPSEVLERVRNAHVVVTNKVVIDAAILKEVECLELICVTATGTNNVDIAFAKTKGVEVKNVKGYSTESVAQHTFACVFQLLHELQFYGDYVSSGKYSEQSLFTNVSKPYNEIKGKTWGIIGLGDIGKRVAEIAKVFGVTVIYYSTSGKNINSLYESVSLDELLQRSEIISIHAPLNDQTYNLIDKDALNKMKSSAILINMGRGGIVNESDLSAAILNEKIKGVALDVFEKEPFPKDSAISKISRLNNVLLTPHIAWAGKESRERLMDATFENINSFYS